MLAVVFVLAAALITLLAVVNAHLRSDLKYYVKLSNDNWQLYQVEAAYRNDALDDLAEAIRKHEDCEQLIQDERAKAAEWKQFVCEKLRPQIGLMRVMLDAMESIDPDFDREDLTEDATFAERKATI